MTFSTKAAGKMIKQLAGNGTGQSLMDRVTQAKYGIAGSALGKTVAKATTVEHIAPKKKHLDYLIQCSHEPNVSIPLLASLFIERLEEKQWAVAFKTLITIHNLMNFGNEKFSQYLASNNCPINQSNFNDKTTARSYEMSLYIRKYSAYLEEKTLSYRAMAFDFCKVKRSREDGVLRLMPTDKLLKALPVLEKQILTLLEFDATEKDLDNPIITAAFVLLYKDLIRLFASYNEGMINLIEKFFSLKRKNGKVALDLYIRFTGLMDKVTQFLTIAEKLGIGDKDCLGLVPVPERVIKAMKQHLKLLGKKNANQNEEEDEDEDIVEKEKPAKEKPKSKKEEKSLKKTPKKESIDESSEEEDGESGLPSDIQKEIIATTLENLNKPKVNVIQPSPYIGKKKLQQDAPSSSSSSSADPSPKKKSARDKVFGDSFVQNLQEEKSPSKKEGKKKKSHHNDKEPEESIPVKYEIIEGGQDEDDEESSRKTKKKHKNSETEGKGKHKSGDKEGKSKKKSKSKKKHSSDEDEDQENSEEEIKHSEEENEEDEEKKTKKKKAKQAKEEVEDTKRKKKTVVQEEEDEEEAQEDTEEEEKKKKKDKKKEKKEKKKKSKDPKSAFDDLIDLDFLTGTDQGEKSKLEPVSIDPVPLTKSNNEIDKNLQNDNDDGVKNEDKDEEEKGTKEKEMTE